MPWRPFGPNDWKPENRVLVVIVTTLQLLLIVVVWLLAIIPASVLALAAITVKAIRGGVARGEPGPRP